MSKFTVDVLQIVVVSLDETKFDETFMQEFRDSFYPFDDLAEHAEHIAQMVARGLYDAPLGSTFIEGYGPADQMGITAYIGSTEVESEAHPS